MEIFEELTARVISAHGSQAFQYDLTEGFMPLREQVAALLEGRGIAITPEAVNITSGSQGVLDAVAKLIIGKGDKIALESPTYLGAISAFNPYEPSYIAMNTDEQGLIPESLSRHLPQNFKVSPSDGGMFLWVTGPKGLDGLALYRKAIENGVAFVPGQFFYTEPGQGGETMRLNYTMADVPALERAVEKLGQAIRQMG